MWGFVLIPFEEAETLDELKGYNVFTWSVICTFFSIKYLQCHSAGNFTYFAPLECSMRTFILAVATQSSVRSLGDSLQSPNCYFQYLSNNQGHYMLSLVSYLNFDIISRRNVDDIWNITEIRSPWGPLSNYRWTSISQEASLSLDTVEHTLRCTRIGDGAFLRVLKGYRILL